MKKLNRLFLTAGMIMASFAIFTVSASATVVPEACYIFSANEITDYDTGNAACVSDPEIPATIGGQAVTSIGANAFEAKALTSVTIPTSVTAIGNRAFYQNQLATVTIPGSVTSIDSSAFADNELESLVILDAPVAIGNGAFSVNNLTSIDLGNSLISLGESAFAFNRLTEVVMPSSVVSLMPNLYFIAQSPYGKDSELMFGDPLQVQTLLDSLWYVRLYTEDSSNPQNFTDDIFLESHMGSDINNDGDQDDSLGGHLINPAQATLGYKNSAGDTLKASETLTGTGLTSYLAAENTTNDGSLYFRLGQSQSFSAPPISGYLTPSAVNLALSSSTTTHDFIYSSISSSTGTLVSTGMSQVLAAVLGVTTLSLGIVVYTKVKRSAGSRFVAKQ